jgi:hypothetical protein
MPRRFPVATKFVPDGSSEEISLPDGEIDLAFLSSLVGGYIEFIYFSDGSMMLVNEEGKLMDMALNRIATYLAAIKGGLYPGDYISGDAVFFSRSEASRID